MVEIILRYLAQDPRNMCVMFPDHTFTFTEWCRLFNTGRVIMMQRDKDKEAQVLQQMGRFMRRNNFKIDYPN